ncbi:endoplasmic reticulum chaperone BiP isoform X2 [Folsomia candida]|nr:endoplasmic reticulum chaperone BiP isoform X2 [Folsomia candida]
MEGIYKTLMLLVTAAAVSSSRVKFDLPPGTPVIGIDLGTTYSCVAISINGRREVIANSQGNRITPSYVAFTPDGHRLIGDAAKSQVTTNPKNTVFDTKRIIGRRWSDRILQAEIKNFPFNVIEMEGKPFIELRTKPGTTQFFSPEEISAMILAYMRETAESYLGVNVTHAVVTVPAYFNNAQRQATRDAAEIAGLHVMKIINEPTSAAMAYWDRTTFDQNQRVLVYDLGGGTLDVTILDIDKEGFMVTATNGNAHLGGEDFERNVVSYFVSRLKKKINVDISQNDGALQKLRREVERVKRVLSKITLATVEVENFLNGQDFSETLTRAKFEDLNYDLFKETLLSIDRVLEDKGLSSGDIDKLILVGGSTRIPKIRQMVQDYVRLEAVSATAVNPDEAVAIGAAVQAGILAGHLDIVDADVLPFTLGLGIKDDQMSVLLERNTPIPASRTKGFTTIKDNQEVVEFPVYEGERPFASDNNFLGSFELGGILPAPKDVPDIQVTFSVNSDGILVVRAKDVATGNVNAITIKNDHGGMSPGEIKRKIREAKDFAREDERVREAFAAKDDLERVLVRGKNLLLLK